MQKYEKSSRKREVIEKKETGANGVRFFLLCFTRPELIKAEFDFHILNVDILTTACEVKDVLYNFQRRLLWGADGI